MINVKFLHVGHHKCGSSFLQYEVLPKIKGLQDLPGKRKDGKSNAELRQAWIRMITQSDMYFDFEKTVRPFYDVDFNCISNEGFVGFGSSEASAGLQVQQTAERLHRLFGDTKILIVIRNQKSILRSMYIDDIEYGLSVPFRKWIEGRAVRSQLDWFRFSGIVETYQKLFGAGNVKVVRYEDLFNVNTLEEIFTSFEISSDGLETVDFGRRVNQSMAAPTLAASKVVNRLIGTRANWADGLAYKYWIAYAQPALNRVSDLLHVKKPNLYYNGYNELLAEQFHDDNRRTSELIGMDLHEHGYP
jgi:hypothetical protein